MRLVWGNDQIGTALNDTRFVWETVARKNAAGFVVGLFGRCVVTEAYLLFNGQAAAKTAMDALFASSKAQRRDLRFLDDAGNATTTAVLTASTEGGVTWDRLTWTDDPGNQYGTWRKFTAEFSWEINTLDSTQRANLLMDYRETVTVQGGLPAFVTHRPVNRTTAVQQVTSEALVWVITQEGFAVSWGDWRPTANAPLWNTTPPLKDRRERETSGDRVGDNVRRRRLEWAYLFERVTSAAAAPIQWTGPFV